MTHPYDLYGLCYGSQQAPAGGSVVGRKLTGPGKYPGKGCCSVCGREYKLLLNGYIRKHGITI